MFGVLPRKGFLRVGCFDLVGALMLSDFEVWVFFTFLGILGSDLNVWGI